MPVSYGVGAALTYLPRSAIFRRREPADQPGITPMLLSLPMAQAAPWMQVVLCDSFAGSFVDKKGS